MFNGINVKMVFAANNYDFIFSEAFGQQRLTPYLLEEVLGMTISN